MEQSTKDLFTKAARGEDQRTQAIRPLTSDEVAQKAGGIEVDEYPLPKR